MKTFTFLLELRDKSCFEFDIDAAGQGEANGYAYAEARKLGAGIGNVARFECIRVRRA